LLYQIRKNLTYICTYETDDNDSDYNDDDNSHNHLTVLRVEKPEGKRTLGGPRRRWEDKIVMDLREVGWKGVDWIHLA